MNNKRTNRIVAILNIVSIISIYILTFSTEYLLSSIMPVDNVGKTIYNSFIIDILLNNVQIIMTAVYIIVGVLNIICAIQNKENKKLLFWQSIFGIWEILGGINTILALEEYEFIKWINIIILRIVPIILAIINLILIRKNKPKKIQIISYIGVIIISILSLFNIIGPYWNIIAIVMQLIYIHFQDKDIIESKQRKVINIILYYIVQGIVVIVFLVMILISLVITKVNETEWKKELANLYNNIETLQGAKIKEVYVPVEKSYKYGFINSKGQEKIQCQYDRVSYFNEITINNSLYYVALAKKENKFYIISKNNKSIMISGNLEKYLKSIEQYLGKTMKETYDKENKRNAYTESCQLYLYTLTKREIKLDLQVLENNMKEINLEEIDSKYYNYTNDNYDMFIEPIYKEGFEYWWDAKHEVTITKNIGKQEISTVYLPDFQESDAKLYAFSNGYIRFEDEDNKVNGWIDNMGNKTTISNVYRVEDITNDKVVLAPNPNITEDNYPNQNLPTENIIIDMTGKILLETPNIDIYDNMYLIKNNSKKMVLIDKELNVISNEYDKIIATRQIDLSSVYSSYY